MRLCVVIILLVGVCLASVAPETNQCQYKNQNGQVFDLTKFQKTNSFWSVLNPQKQGPYQLSYEFNFCKSLMSKVKDVSNPREACLKSKASNSALLDSPSVIEILMKDGSDTSECEVLGITEGTMHEFYGQAGVSMTSGVKISIGSGEICSYDKTMRRSTQFNFICQQEVLPAMEGQFKLGKSGRKGCQVNFEVYSKHACMGPKPGPMGDLESKIKSHEEKLVGKVSTSTTTTSQAPAHHRSFIWTLFWIILIGGLIYTICTNCGSNGHEVSPYARCLNNLISQMGEKTGLDGEPNEHTTMGRFHRKLGETVSWCKNKLNGGTQVERLGNYEMV